MDKKEIDLSAYYGEISGRPHPADSLAMDENVRSALQGLLERSPHLYRRAASIINGMLRNGAVDTKSFSDLLTAVVQSDDAFAAASAKVRERARNDLAASLADVQFSLSPGDLHRLARMSEGDIRAVELVRRFSILTEDEVDEAVRLAHASVIIKS